MSAGNSDLYVEQGATFQRTLTFKDPSNALVDITGWVFTGQIRKRYDSPDVIASFTFAIQDQTTAKGQVLMTMSPADTLAIPVDKSSGVTKRITKYAYDVQVLIPGGEVDRVIEGIANVSPEVTRA